MKLIILFINSEWEVNFCCSYAKECEYNEDLCCFVEKMYKVGRFFCIVYKLMDC
jgi:hypothetical protein